MKLFCSFLLSDKMQIKFTASHPNPDCGEYGGCTGHVCKICLHPNWRCSRCGWLRLFNLWGQSIFDYRMLAGRRWRSEAAIECGTSFSSALDNNTTTKWANTGNHSLPIAGLQCRDKGDSPPAAVGAMGQRQHKHEQSTIEHILYICLCD